MKPAFNIVILISKIEQNKKLIKQWLFQFIMFPCLTFININEYEKNNISVTFIYIAVISHNFNNIIIWYINNLYYIFTK